MLLFIIAFWVGQWLLIFLAIVQFIWLLAAREPNQFIARFGNSLSTWFAEVGRFLTCATVGFGDIRRRSISEREYSPVTASQSMTTPIC